MSDCRLLAVAVIAATLLLGTWSHVRPQPAAPAKRDPLTAESWMLDALPGIGSMRRDAAAAAVREGRSDQLPRGTRIAVAEAFTQATDPQP